MKTFSKHFEISISLKNTHNQGHAGVNDEIHIVGMGDENIILDIPFHFCVQGHSITIAVYAKIHHSIHDLKIESEAHLVESSETNISRITAHLRFTSHNQDQWKQLLQAVEEAQEKIEKKLGAFKE